MRYNEVKKIQAVLRDFFDKQIIRLNKFEKSVDSKDNF